VIDKIEHRGDITLASVESELTLAVRRPDKSRLKWANDVLDHPNGKHPHRWSKIYAQEAQHLSKYPPTLSIKLQAFRIGEVAIAAMPCEVFAGTGLAIKKESPHRFTFSIELANGYHELLDAAELQARAITANEKRLAMGKNPLPEENRLIEAMRSGLPPCTGVALGFDRLLMLAAGADTLADVMTFYGDRA